MNNYYYVGYYKNSHPGSDNDNIVVKKFMILAATTCAVGADFIYEAYRKAYEENCISLELAVLTVQDLLAVKHEYITEENDVF